MADFQSIADQFVDYYYKAFDSDRTSLSALYRPQSMMTWEKEPFMGEKIIEKLVSLPFAKIQHRVDTKDAQPSNETGGIMVMVTGALMFDEQQHPMNYVQVFNLQSDSGNYFVQNDIFRLRPGGRSLDMSEAALKALDPIGSQIPPIWTKIWDTLPRPFFCI